MVAPIPSSANSTASSSLFVPFTPDSQASANSLLGSQITTLALGEEGGQIATPVSTLNSVLSGADSNRDNKTTKEELTAYTFQLNIVTILLDVFSGFMNLPALSGLLAPLKEQLKAATLMIANFDKLAGADGDSTALSSADINLVASRDGDASSLSQADLIPPPPPAPASVPTTDAITAFFKADSNGDSLLTKEELSTRRQKAQQELDELNKIVNIQFDPVRDAKIKALQAELAAEDYLIANFEGLATIKPNGGSTKTLSLLEILSVASKDGNVLDLSDQDRLPVLPPSTQTSV